MRRPTYSTLLAFSTAVSIFGPGTKTPAPSPGLATEQPAHLVVRAPNHRIAGCKLDQIPLPDVDQLAPIDQHLHEVAGEIVCTISGSDGGRVAEHRPVASFQIFRLHHHIDIERRKKRPGMHLLERDGYAAVGHAKVL